MNRLILVGNGFDLAHNMPTSYQHFIKWYLNETIHNLWSTSIHDDPLLLIRPKNILDVRPFVENVSPEKFIEGIYQNGCQSLFSDEVKIEGISGPMYIPFKIEAKTAFFKNCLGQIATTNWVDIENEFYKVLLKERNSAYEIEKLNNAMAFVTEKLKEYLKTLDSGHMISQYYSIIEAQSNPEDILRKVKSVEIENLMVLNFNYTTTVEKYLKSYTKQRLINYIHGSIHDPKNPMIFGFGDNIDSKFQALEDANNNELLKYLKLFGYLRTNNHDTLIKFLAQTEYEVIILGLSCGLSDRTLLNKIFEHNNCVSIRIYYHRIDDKIDNFTSITQEISRHFKNKELFLERVVKYPSSSFMPQLP